MLARATAGLAGRELPRTTCHKAIPPRRRCAGRSTSSARSSHVDARPPSGSCPRWDRYTGVTFSAARSPQQCETVVMSLFVNPAQFSEADVGRYPRDEAAISSSLRSRASTSCSRRPPEMYPDGFQTWGGHGARRRPRGRVPTGHFRGVATVVLKLSIARPRRIYFDGQKDAQQVEVIRRMVGDLAWTSISVSSRRSATRTGSLSSRNSLLSAEERKRALALPGARDARPRRGAPRARGVERTRDRLHRDRRFRPAGPRRCGPSRLDTTDRQRSTGRRL